MSIIVWDGYDIASDMAFSDGQVLAKLEKLWKLNDLVIGGVGPVHDVMSMKQWVIDGRNVSDFPKVSQTSTFVVVSAQTGLLRYTDKPVAIAHGFNACAFGSGRDFAYGALHMGANAEGAVRAAAKYSPDCGAGILCFGVRK